MIDEEALIRKARQGDLAAFNRLVLTHQDAVYRQALYMTGSKSQAEDLCEQVFRTAFARIRECPNDSMGAWLLQLATQITLEAQPGVLWMDPAVSSNGHLLAGLQKLAPTERAAVVLVDVQALDFRTAAAILGVPPSALLCILSQGRRRLRDVNGHDAS